MLLRDARAGVERVLSGAIGSCRLRIDLGLF